MVEVMKRIVTSFKRSRASTAALSAPNPAAGHHQPMPLLGTSGHSQASLVSLLWGHCSFLLGLGVHKVSLQFSSVTQSCLTLCNPMDCSTPGLPVHHRLLEFTETHVHRVGDAIQPSKEKVIPFSSCPQSFPASGSFQMRQLFASDGQSIGVSASKSVLPMNIQD